MSVADNQKAEQALARFVRGPVTVEVVGVKVPPQLVPLDPGLVVGEIGLCLPRGLLPLLPSCSHGCLCRVQDPTPEGDCHS